VHYIDYDYVKSVIREREAGMRRAQLSGAAYVNRPRRILSWPWARRAERATSGSTRVAPAS
jgi:hypothetical protein